MTFTYIGTSGNDLYYHTSSDPLLAYGLAGNDKLYGYGNNHIVRGGDGNDSLFGGGNSTLIGGAGHDSIASYGNNIILIGGAGNDQLGGDIISDCTLVGGVGDDTLNDPVGNNYLVGGRGNDVLLSYGGNDTLTGGTGTDIFRFVSFPQGNGYATITDFRRAQGDKIDVYGSVSNYSLDQSQNLSGQLSLDTAIYYGDILVAVVQDNLNVSLSSDLI